MSLWVLYSECIFGEEVPLSVGDIWLGINILNRQPWKENVKVTRDIPTFCFFFFFWKKKKIASICPLQWGPLSFYRVGCIVRCDALDTQPASLTHVTVWKQEHWAKAHFWNWRERLELFTKMTFPASKTLTGGWFSFPFGIVAFPLSGFLLLSAGSLSLVQMVVPNLWT